VTISTSAATPTSPVPVPVLSAEMSFDDAARLVVDYLTTAVPLGYWAVTRYDGERQLNLEVRDDTYGVKAGDSHPWADTFCIRMHQGRGPQIAPDAMAVAAYAETEAARQLTIGAYVGIPIVGPDQDLFGTLCGIDPAVHGEELERHAPLLQMLGSLLSMVLAADLARTELERERERARTEATTDALTGLLNRRGWDLAVEREESRCRRFGDPSSVLVIDLDRLKEINDTNGHLAGDRHIVKAAEALNSCVRGYDHVARIGGDEFAVVVTGMTPAQTQQLIGRIHSAFTSTGVSGSIGHAPYTIVAGFPGAFAEADAAMDEQKRSRRGIPGRRPPAPVTSVG
jgi:diguanylate cyclase